ncbi:hypothetical protein OG440_35120 [Streptomyces sp. NBC_00637]|uniref:hypothetical protein n=1 Tax=Streptomyces sp. NBC_00637 TaxID=2903667 RepID=UPI0032495102
MRVVRAGPSSDGRGGRPSPRHSPLTVRTHVHRAMTELRARDRAQPVVIAFRSGLVRVPEPLPGDR